MIDSPIPDMGKLHHLGSRHAQFVESPGDRVEYTEKVDGSQFSFILDSDNELHFRSKRAVINPYDAGMFGAGVESIRSRKALLCRNVVYRGEYLARPKQNALTYDRIPEGHVYLFRVDLTPDQFLSTAELVSEAGRIGLEPPHVLQADVDKETQQSCLGGVVAEGYVVKNYDRCCPMTGKWPLMAKWVRSSFREIAGGEWKKANPSRQDLVDQLAEEVCSEARMLKAVQHLAEQGLLENSPKDIPLLMKEMSDDIRIEASDYIAERLLARHLPDILRKAVHPFPQWYRKHIGYGE